MTMNGRLRSTLLLGIVLAGCSDDATAPQPDVAALEAGAADGSAVDRSKRDAGPTCDEIKAELTAQVELAKSCQPQSASQQCTRIINQDALPCGCPAFVNPANTEANAKLDDLLGAWRRKGCGVKIECKPCSKPTSGSCEATPSGSKVPGLCKSSR